MFSHYLNPVEGNTHGNIKLLFLWRTRWDVVAETVEDLTLEKKFCKNRWVAKGAGEHRENRKAKKLYKGKRVWKNMDDF